MPCGRGRRVDNLGTVERVRVGTAEDFASSDDGVEVPGQIVRDGDLFGL